MTNLFAPAMTDADKIAYIMRGGEALALGGWCDRYKAEFGELIQDSTISARFRRELQHQVRRLQPVPGSRAWRYQLIGTHLSEYSIE